MSVLEAMALNTRAVLILNTANRSSLPVSTAAVVEVPAVGRPRRAASRSRSAKMPAHARALVSPMKEVERTAIAAAQSGSQDAGGSARSRCTRSCPSVTVAREILDGYRVDHPPALAAFAA